MAPGRVGVLVANLLMHPPEKFDLVFMANDPESRTLAFQLRAALTNAAWTCESVLEIQEPPAAFGIFAPSATDGVKALTMWARRAGFNPDVRALPRLQRPRIVIGRQR
jgi:hypothetical protein